MMKIPFGVPALAARFKIIDLAVFFVVLGILSLILYVASGWRSVMIPSLVIDLDPVNIPYYAAQSMVRMFLAYVLSLLFSIWYGYTANRSKTHEQIMIPLLDVLQSIPVLSFLPGVVLAMIALFPERRIGLEQDRSGIWRSAITIPSILCRMNSLRLPEFTGIAGSPDF
jgi:NitT/TauT family transport system permease protein